ncbi:MAG: flagellar hook-basal body complex protein FliE [Gemmatimonadetes bacterium SCN 70-22]|nr:MAG: flagellar hook-basal body complex protein FliE [Gemmatimonadetes bacterium SCN 70-22]
MTAPIRAGTGGAPGIGTQRPPGIDTAGERGRRGAVAGTNDSSFGDTLKRALSEVTATQDGARELQERFVRGEPVELHRVMAATEEASIALEMLVQLRNKAVEAYRTLVTMQG